MAADLPTWWPGRVAASRRARSLRYVGPADGATEGAAWDKAKRILSGMTGALGWSRRTPRLSRTSRRCGRRQFALAQEKDVHDERLWMGIHQGDRRAGQHVMFGGHRGTGSLVSSSPIIVLASHSSCYAALIQSTTPIEFGRELIPRLKSRHSTIDQRQLADAN